MQELLNTFVTIEQKAALTECLIQRAREIRLQERMHPDPLILDAYNDHSKTAGNKTRMHSAFIPGQQIEGLTITVWKYAGGYTAPALVSNNLRIHVLSAGASISMKSQEEYLAWNILEEGQERLFLVLQFKLRDDGVLESVKLLMPNLLGETLFCEVLYERPVLEVVRRAA